jgi:hypothetical protein
MQSTRPILPALSITIASGATSRASSITSGERDGRLGAPVEQGSPVAIATDGSLGNEEVAPIELANEVYAGDRHRVGSGRWRAEAERVAAKDQIVAIDLLKKRACEARIRVDPRSARGSEAVDRAFDREGSEQALRVVREIAAPE